MRTQELISATAASNPGVNRAASINNINYRILRGSRGNVPRSDAGFGNTTFTSYPVIQILLNRRLNLQESISSTEKVTQVDEKDSSTSDSQDEGLSCLAYRLLVQVLPHEKTSDIAKRKMLLFNGLLDLFEILTLADESEGSADSWKTRRRDVRSLVETIMVEPPSKDVIARRSEVRRKIVDILETHTNPEQATYMSEVGPLLQDLVTAVISAEQTSGRNKRAALRQKARNIIETILKLSEKENEKQTRDFYNIVNYILEELYPALKRDDEMQTRRHVQGGLRELIGQVCAAKDPIAICIEGLHDRDCRIRCKELNANVKKFMEMAVPDTEVEDTCALRDECQVAIREMLEYCIPVDETDKSLRSVLRSQVHKILAMLCRGFHHAEEPRRQEIRECVKDHLISIMTIIKIETQRKLQEDKQVYNILNKILPLEETENIYHQRNCARSGIEELLDKVTPTTSQIDPLPAASTPRHRRSTLASLKVPQLVDQLFPHKPSGERAAERRATVALTDDLVETVLPRSEGSQDEDVAELRDDVAHVFSTLQSLEGGLLEADPEAKSEARSVVQQRLHSIIRRAVAEEERRSHAWDSNINDVLFRILSAGEIKEAIERKRLLCRYVYQLFDRAVPSVVSNQGKILPGNIFARSTIRAAGSYFLRRITLHSDIDNFVEVIVEKEKLEYPEVECALERLLENVVPSTEAHHDSLLRQFRHEAGKLMEILMSFEKCIHDPVKKQKMSSQAHMQLTKMLKTVDEISLRSNSQWRGEMEEIVDKLLPDIDNPSKFERKCTLRRGIEDLLVKVFTDRNVESIMLKRSSELRKELPRRKSTLSEVLQLFVEDVIPDKQEEFTIQRRNRLIHVLEHLTDIVVPSAECEENSAQNYLRSNFKELLETVIVLHDIADEGARKKARYLLRYRLENVLRDAEIMEIQRRANVLEEIDDFINKLFSDEQTEDVYEKKRRIALGIEELLGKLLASGEEHCVIPITKDLNHVRNEIKKFVDMVVLDKNRSPEHDRNEIDKMKRSLVDTVIPPSEAKDNIRLSELHGDIERVLDTVADIEQEEDPLQREQIRSEAREHIGNVVTGVDLEIERRSLQVFANTENILNKIIPTHETSDATERRRTLHRGIEELAEKAASTSQGEIMMLRRSTLPSEQVMTRIIKNIVVRVIPDEDDEDSPNRQREIHSSVKVFLDKTIPSSECLDCSNLQEMRETMEELLGTVVPAALRTSDPQTRHELRAVARGHLESIVRTSDVEAQQRRTLLHDAMQSILIKLLPGDDVGSELRKRMMLADVIEEMFSKIRLTVNVDRQSTLINNNVESKKLREEAEQIAEHLLDNDSPIEAPERKSRVYSFVDGLLRKILVPVPETPALAQLHNETKSLLSDVVPVGLAERNASRRNTLREKALEHLQAIVHASETQHKRTLEQIDEEAVEILDKIIPETNDSPQSVLQEGIQEVVEKVVPIRDEEGGQRLTRNIATFVKRISQPPDLRGQPPTKSADETRKEVHEFMDSVFLAEEGVEFGESVDDLEDVLLNTAEAQSEPDQGRRSNLRDQTQPILENIIKNSPTGKAIKVPTKAAAVQTIYLALDHPRPIVTISALELPISCGGKKKGLFGGLFPWKGKMFSRKSRKKTGSKADIEGKVSKSHKKQDKRKRKENKRAEEKLRNDIFDLP